MTEENRNEDADNTESSEMEEEGPKVGPADRQREFVEEHFAPLRRKMVTSDEAAIEQEEEEAPAAGTAEPPQPDIHGGVVQQYRRQQRRVLPTNEQPSEDEGERSEDEGDDGSDGPDGEEDDPPASDPRPPRDPISTSQPSPPQPPANPPNNSWTPLGPSVMREGQGSVRPAVSGRTPGIAVVPGGERVYIASANGGVWRSEDTGQSWRPLMNAFDVNPIHTASDSLACGAIAIVPGASTEQDRIYVGSGEGAGAAYFGVGPIISTNGGQDWNTEPVAPGNPELAGSAFYALAIDPADTERVVGATRKGAYRREPGSGGFHWALKNLPGAGSSWITSVVVARSGGTTTFYAASWFGPVFASTDGDAWTQVGTGFPTDDVGRIGLAVQPNNPDVVYALICHSGNGSMLGVWRLDVPDNTWRQVTGHPNELFGTAQIGFQGTYDLAIAVDPNNVNRLFMGGSTRLADNQWSGSLYRCEATSSGAGTSFAHSMTNTYIGSSVHADIHTIVFAPGDSSKLWVGCDGGVYYSTNPVGSGEIFEARNIGLATLTMEHLAQHPTESAVLFCGTQDNGTARFTGEEVWLHSAPGDGGFAVINWNDPYKVLRTYIRGWIYRATDGGQGYGSWTWAGLAATDRDNALFYAPLVGTPQNNGRPAEAEIVAFGGRRPWVSTDFGTSWHSVPNNDASDNLPAQIRSMVFASATRFYAGTVQFQTAGGTIDSAVYRFDNDGSNWTRTRIDILGGADALGLAGRVTDIAEDTSDASGDSVYISFGGTGDFAHVWHFDGTRWESRSGPSAGNANSLLDVQHDAIVVDPANPNHIYAGADIGVWRSTDGGQTWSTFSEGLPDAAVIDLRLHAPSRLLRVSTHGRGVFERLLDGVPGRAVELFIRDTQLDQGRSPTVDGGPDPTAPGQNVQHTNGPDIKFDVPDSSVQYQFPAGDINFLQFVDELEDESDEVPTPHSGVKTTRVYIQVHNHGVQPANNVRVMLLLANASTGVPPLAAAYAADVQNGAPINSGGWQTIGIKTLNDLRTGFPRIASFEMSSSMLPLPADLAGNEEHVVLALVHEQSDQFTATETDANAMSINERQAAMKGFRVVAVGTPVTGTGGGGTPCLVALFLIPAALVISAIVSPIKIVRALETKWFRK